MSGLMTCVMACGHPLWDRTIAFAEKCSWKAGPYLADMMPEAVILPENEEGAKILAEHKGECLVFMSSKDIYNIADMVKELL